MLVSNLAETRIFLLNSVGLKNKNQKPFEYVAQKAFFIRNTEGVTFIK
jgi:hypothetical protein